MVLMCFCAYVNFFLSYYFPVFSAEIAEEKLRYAAYNCIAIDADMSPWEE